EGKTASQGGKAVKGAGPIAVQTENPIYQPYETLTGSTRRTPVLGHVTALVTIIIEQATRVFQTRRRWGTTVAAAVLVLVVASWVAYSAHRVASPLQSSAKPGSVKVEQPPVLPTKMVPSEPVPK